MPRAGTYPSAGPEAEQGATAALGRLARTVPSPRPGTPGVPAPQPPQTLPAEAGGPSSPELNGGFDQVLFGPSDRPGEPVTHGMPFGAGANFIMRPYESPVAFQMRVADELEKDPNARGLTAYIEKLRFGG